MRSFAFALLVLVSIVVMAPATLVDRIVSEVTQGDIRIGETKGSVWSGSGQLNVVDLATLGRRPWRRVQWSFDPIGLFRGEMTWQIITGTTGKSQASVGIFGWRLLNFGISGPARNFLQRMPGPLGKLGWDGDIDLSIAGLDCSWRRICDAQIEVRWNGAGSSFLPGQVFGDYQMKVRGVAGEFELDWNSAKESNVQTSGTGKLTKSGDLGLTGTVKGDPELLSRLPAVAGPWAKPTSSRDTWRIVFP